MDNRVSPIATLQDIRRIANLWGVGKAPITLLDGHKNGIFAYANAQGEFILRVGLVSDRSPSEVKAELHWLSYLISAGFSASAPIPSMRGALFELFPQAEPKFICCSFRRAEGTKPPFDVVGEWNPVLYRKWGAMLATLHQLTMAYEPPPESVRKHWDEDKLIRGRLGAGIVDDDVPVIALVDNYIKDMSKKPTNRENYGLVHADFHHNNFLVDRSGNITLIDFDDAIHHWFSYDIAVVIYGSVFAVPREDDVLRLNFGSRFAAEFLDGYASVMNLPPNYRNDILEFLMLRDMYTYLYYLDRWKTVGDLTDKKRNRAKMFRERIIRREPYIDLRAVLGR